MSGSTESSASGMRGGSIAGSLAVEVTFTIFLAIALYNSLELLVLIFSTFRRFRGLYFWSLLLSVSLGIVPQSVGHLLKDYELAPLWLSLPISTVGWYFMVTGQAVVLYSRLHLVVQEDKTLGRVKYMIICNAIILHIPTTVLTYGSSFSNRPSFLLAYDIMEKIELTGFCIQEFIISLLYIKGTLNVLRTSLHQGYRQAILHRLLAVNCLIIIMDIALLVVEYVNLYIVQTTLKSMVYSIKLKLEFAILGQLIAVFGSSNRPRESRLQDSPPADVLESGEQDVNSLTANPASLGRTEFCFDPGAK